MRDTLEDLYYSNITPCDKRIKSGTALQQTLAETERLEEQLEDKLDKEGRVLLHRLSNAENEVGNTIASENFILGFRLGMRLVSRDCWTAMITAWLTLREQFIQINPSEGCKLPKIEKTEMKVLLPEQIGDYLQEAGKRGLLPASTWNSPAACAGANCWPCFGQTWTAKTRPSP